VLALPVWSSGESSGHPAQWVSRSPPFPIVFSFSFLLSTANCPYTLHHHHPLLASRPVSPLLLLTPYLTASSRPCDHTDQLPFGSSARPFFRPDLLPLSELVRVSCSRSIQSLSIHTRSLSLHFTNIRPLSLSLSLSLSCFLSCLSEATTSLRSSSSSSSPNQRPHLSLAV
jgi:hypothetical protein